MTTSGLGTYVKIIFGQNVIRKLKRATKFITSIKFIVLIENILYYRRNLFLFSMLNSLQSKRTSIIKAYMALKNPKNPQNHKTLYFYFWAPNDNPAKVIYIEALINLYIYSVPKNCPFAKPIRKHCIDLIAYIIITTH